MLLLPVRGPDLGELSQAVCVCIESPGDPGCVISSPGLQSLCLQNGPAPQGEFWASNGSSRDGCCGPHHAGAGFL